MNKKKSILITGVHMGIGGIETVLSNFLNTIDFTKYDVDLILYKNIGVNLVNIPDSVNIYSPFLYKKRLFLNKLTMKDGIFNKIIRKIFFNKFTYKMYVSNKKYDVGISYAGYHYLMDMLIAKSNCKKKYIWVHTDMKYCIDHMPDFKKNFYNNYNKYSYFDGIVAVSNSALQQFKKLLPDYKGKMVYIWNLFPEKRLPGNTKLSGKYNIVLIGRLEMQKGYDRLITITKKLLEIRNDFTMYVIGGGSLYNQINNQIYDNNLSDYIKLLGPKNNVHNYLNSANLLLSTSYYEGLSTTLVEALIYGVPIVAPNVTGISDIYEEISPKGAIILTDNNDEAIKCGIIDAMEGKLLKNFKFEAKKFNKITKKRYEEILGGKI